MGSKEATEEEEGAGKAEAVPVATTSSHDKGIFFSTFRVEWIPFHSSRDMNIVGLFIKHYRAINLSPAPTIAPDTCFPTGPVALHDRQGERLQQAETDTKKKVP